MISLDLMKSSEVRKAGDRANYLIITYHYFARLVERFEKSTPYSRSNRRVTQRYLRTYSIVVIIEWIKILTPSIQELRQNETEILFFTKDFWRIQIIRWRHTCVVLRIICTVYENLLQSHAANDNNNNTRYRWYYYYLHYTMVPMK